MDAFAQALQSYLQTSRELRQRSASEDSLRDAFLHFLRTTFPRLSQTEALELEKYIPGLRVRGGFADVLYEDLIFEFKRHLDDAAIQQAEPQLVRYLRNQPHPEKFFGILTDGLKLRVYAWRDERLSLIDSLDLDETLLQNPEIISRVRLWLDAYLFHERALTPTTEDIVRRFGEHSPTFYQGVRLLEKLWREEAQSNSTARTKFAEWQNLLSLVYGSKVGDPSLFLRHTYLALFARVLVQVVLDQRAPADEELTGLLSGDAFQRKGLENFGQADFFVWMDPHHPDIQAFLRAIALRLLSTYDLSVLSEDLLKGLYQELVDPQTRHDLGEFYTPDWLAELTLCEAGFLEAENPSLLDPACGSGTFLFTAIRLRSQKLQGPALVEWAISHLAGLEVHPLAVFIARTNFLLALRPHLQGYRNRLLIPIYMADALSLPEKETDQSALLISVPADDIAQSTGKDRFSLPPFFELPVWLARDARRFQQALSALMEFARPNLPEEAARTGLEKRLRELDPSFTDLSPWQRNLRLMRWLLKDPPTDTVWGFILNNASQPALLAHRKFDFVAGNPPWLAYRYVQRSDYQKRLSNLFTKTYQLLQGQETQLFTQMELATLFFAVCERHYLKEGGTLAFVMPRSILTGAKQHAAFQKRYLTCAHHLLDCEKVSPLFKVPTCVVIYRKGSAPPASTVPVTRWEGQLPTHNVPWQQASKALHSSEGTFTPPEPLGQSPYLPQIIQGATLVPRAFWFVRPAPHVIVYDEERPQVETDPRIQPQAKAPWKGLSLRGAVEAHYLYATLLSDDLLPFGWRGLSLVVLPLKDHKLLSPDEAIAQGHTGLANWLQKAIALWEKHRKSQEELLPYLNWQNKLTRQTSLGPYKLLYNTSGTHLCACVIDTRSIADTRLHDLPVQGFVADTTTYWLETENREEAHYLCAILNSPFVDEYIKPFQTKGSFGATSGKGERHIHRRPFEVLPIPWYDGKDEGHRRLAELSRACHEKVAAFMKGMRGEEDEDRKPRIGTLRQKVREMLREELQEIEKLTRGLLAVEEVSPLASEASPELFAGAEGEITS